LCEFTLELSKLPVFALIAFASLSSSDSTASEFNGRVLIPVRIPVLIPVSLRLKLRLLLLLLLLLL